MRKRKRGIEQRWRRSPDRPPARRATGPGLPSPAGHGRPASSSACRAPRHAVRTARARKMQRMSAGTPSRPAPMKNSPYASISGRPAASRSTITPGKPLRELADVGVRGAQECVLRRGVAEARQARHVGDERDAGEADAEIVDEHDGGEHAQVGAGVGERREVRDDENLQDDAGDQRPEVAEAQRAEAAGGDADRASRPGRSTPRTAPTASFESPRS